MNVMLIAVRERTREIGVRKAVGATSRAIRDLCGGQPAPDAAVFAGLLATWQSGLASFALLGATALFAAMYPARRAAEVDPIEALRYEAGG